MIVDLLKSRLGYGLFVMVLLFCNSTFFTFAQNPDPYYLVDTALFHQLTPWERQMIEATMVKFHAEQNDSLKYSLLHSMYGSFNDNDVWVLYAHYINQKIEEPGFKEKNRGYYNSYKPIYYNDLGYYAHFKGNVPEAISYYRKSVQFNKASDQESKSVYSLSNIGQILLEQGEREIAFQTFQEAYRVSEAVKDRYGMVEILEKLSLIHQYKGELEEALKGFEQSLATRHALMDSLSEGYQMPNKIRIAYCHSHLANIHNLLGHKAQAKTYLLESLRQNEALGNNFGTVNSLEQLSKMAMEDGDWQTAKTYTDKALKISKETGSPALIRDANHLAYRITKRKQQHQQALNYFEQYIQMRDSVANETNAKESLKQHMSYEYEKKEALLLAEQEKEALAHDEKVKRQELTIWSVGAGLLLVMIFSVFLYNRFKVTQQQRNVIASQKLLVDIKNKHITDSIRYAEKIQEAILPGPEDLNKAFGAENYFVLFRPKDLVSGDFYWLHEAGDYLIWAVADCTGHGVPGAFMSMIGNSLLNEIIIEKKTYQPNAILDQLRTGIKNALGHSDETDARKDGMDIALCVWDKRTNILSYAGAYNPLYLIRPNAAPQNPSPPTLIPYKGDRQPIGIYIKEHPFSVQQIQLQKGDLLYLFSDGFMDQFGGPNNKKYGPKKFREQLMQIYEQPLAIQEQLLRKSLVQWQGERDQIDDVCVFGVKVGA